MDCERDLLSPRKSATYFAAFELLRGHGWNVASIVLSRSAHQPQLYQCRPEDEYNAVPHAGAASHGLTKSRERVCY